MTEPLDDYTHRVLWLGRVRIGVQRLLLARGRAAGGGIPAGPPRWSDEVSHLLTGVPASGADTLDAVDEELAAYDAVLQERLRVTREERGTAPGDALRALGLGFDEECLLWAVAAPQIDPAATRLFRMTGGVGATGVHLDYAAAVAFGHRHRDLDRALVLLAPGRALLRLRVLVGAGDLLETARVHPDVAARLVGAAPASLAGLVEPVAPLEQLVMPEGVLDRAREAPRLWMVGPDGAGRRSLAAALSGGCWSLDAARIDPRTGAPVLRDVIREVRLAGAALHVRSGDRWLARATADAAFVATLVDLLSDHPLPVSFDSLAAPSLSVTLPGLRWLELPTPDEPSRRRLWRQHLPGAPDATITDLSRRYLMTGGQIARAAERATDTSFSELARRARAEQTSELSTLCQRVEHTLGWEDLVVSGAVRAQLQDVLDYARLRQRIFDDWGFHRKLAYGRGMTVLLAGPPGTGKTMLAGVLAGELGLDLYMVDLSQVTSKYVGETEKQLDRIFSLAEQTHAMLLFDEADSLFARRTEVRSSNDRWANLEVNFLLQRVEAYDGPTVLTTNFKSALDEALLRRIRFKIDLDKPGPGDRARLWRTMLPPEAPVAADVDYEWLGRDFDLSGGEIKNAVVRAAIQAAAGGTSITMDVLCDAAEATCEETGRLVRRRES
ncbi:MAG: hypothetical protein AMXMBFR64_40530 [Myxococcales bacterium]